MNFETLVGSLRKRGKYRVLIAASASKELESIDGKPNRARLVKAILSLAKNPRGSLTAKSCRARTIAIESASETIASYMKSTTKNASSTS